MRFVWTVAVAGLVCGTVHPPTGTPQPKTSGEGSRIVDDLRQQVFGTSRVEWRTKSASDVWTLYRGSPDDLETTSRETADGMWCAIASNTGNGTEREAVFYAIREELPIDCRLEELRYATDSSFGRTDDYDAIGAALSAWLGVPSWREGVDPAYSRPTYAIPKGGHWGRPSGRWKNLQHWNGPGFHVFVYRDRSRVEVLARTALLGSALLTSSASTTLERYGRSRLEWALVNNIRTRFPDAVRVIQAGETIIDPLAADRAVLPLLAALKASRRPEERTMLATAVAVVLREYVIEHEGDVLEGVRLPEFRRYGLGFVREPYSVASWRYDGKFTNAILDRYPETFWSQLVTVERIDTGWTQDCGPQHAQVIYHGTRWLASHPRSEFTARIMFDIAQAYETAWSLSVLPTEENSQQWPVTEEDKRARVKAIEWYERLLRHAPASNEALSARRNLLHLRLGIDTGQRRYFCEYA